VIFSPRKCITKIPVNAPIELYHAENSYNGILPYLDAYENININPKLGINVKYLL
jgi:hypothetical protein